MVNPEASHWWQHADLSVLENQLATLLAQGRIGRNTALERFLEADPTRCGCVTTVKFKQCCRHLWREMPFTEDQLQAIMDQYAAPDSKVSFRLFGLVFTQLSPCCVVDFFHVFFFRL